MTRLACLLGRDASMMRCKLSARAKITKAVEMAIGAVVPTE
jgi:hypothetical protein